MANAATRFTAWLRAHKPKPRTRGCGYAGADRAPDEYYPSQQVRKDDPTKGWKPPDEC